MGRVGGRQEKMEGHCSTFQNPQWAVVSMEEEEEEEEEEEMISLLNNTPAEQWVFATGEVG